jgi:hypothetical protein
MDSEVEATNLSPNPVFLIGSEYLLFMLVVVFGMFLIGRKMMLTGRSIASFILERSGSSFQIHILLLSRWNKPSKPIKTCRRTSLTITKEEWGREPNTF